MRKLPERKSIWKAGAAFQTMSLRLAVKVAVWWRTVKAGSSRSQISSMRLNIALRLARSNSVSMAADSVFISALVHSCDCCCWPCGPCWPTIELIGSEKPALFDQSRIARVVGDPQQLARLDRIEGRHRPAFDEHLVVEFPLQARRHARTASPQAV